MNDFLRDDPDQQVPLHPPTTQNLYQPSGLEQYQQPGTGQYQQQPMQGQYQQQPGTGQYQQPMQGYYQQPQGANQYAYQDPRNRPPQAMSYIGQPHVVAKNPGLAAFFSFIWTGAGQIYNGQVGLGLVLMFVQLINFFLMFIIIGFFTWFATTTFAVYQAHTYAKEFNARYGIIS